MKSEAKKSIEMGSKSFYLASFFFPKNTKEDCWILYRWCRHCDDVIDSGGTQSDLEDLKLQTIKGLKGDNVNEVFADLGEICRKHSIPDEYPLELLAGFAKDIHSVKVKSETELETYAYQVAGVVGLMMSYIMKADMAVAKNAAISMGNAMQLTNIARDVREDFQNGRVYLPKSWLQEALVQEEQLLALDQREQVFSVVQRLLEKADDLYLEGRNGLKHLPFRCALAVSIAAAIYSGIGAKIIKLGPSSLDSRVYIPLPHKILLVGVGIFGALAFGTERLFFWRSNAKI